MLFNSVEFFVFLGVVLVGFFALSRTGNLRAVLAWLTAGSFFFYGWWNPVYLLLIGFSILVNYGLGLALARNRSKMLVILGVTFNLGLIGVFKYANFFADALGDFGFVRLDLPDIVLPLAISFFTFQQIAFIVDVYRGKEGEHSLLKYALFVVFFPQLIAGPIVHYKQTIPQLTPARMFDDAWPNLAVGMAYFGFGLFKKLVIADGVALYSTPVFEASEAGVQITFLEAWTAAVAYTFQIYFDFSGYSDMAIGLARMFGVRLPINFNSPYRASSIIDFWRRWHITLSTFLRDYLYIPLGGGRVGQVRRYGNILTVMLLGGLWHGAGWTFILWGALHGVMILINHGFQDLRHRLFPAAGKSGPVTGAICTIFVFLLVVVAWVPFRAESIDSALALLQAMSGFDGLVMPPTYAGLLDPIAGAIGLPVEYRILSFYDGRTQIGYMLLLLAIAWLMPNTHQIMHKVDPALGAPSAVGTLASKFLYWRPNLFWAAVTASAFLISLYMILIGRQDEFLYFQF
ncbi:MBOAT family O-acyltransferase [Hwanghaeella sp.]|uniref:MBOAT family O-acyltransferase n=1 Tax=Hwanghaeella sp. TaxID=2605943 RepID=UPI003CCBF1C1